MDQEGKKRMEDKRTHGKPLLASRRHADAISFNYFTRIQVGRVYRCVRLRQQVSPHSLCFLYDTCKAKKNHTCKLQSRVNVNFHGNTHKITYT